MKRVSGLLSVISLTLILSACTGETSSEPKLLSETITEITAAIEAVDTREDETKHFVEITDVIVKPAIRTSDNQLGLELIIHSNSSNIETQDWNILLKTVVAVLGTEPQNYTYDVSIPEALPAPDPTETAVPTPTPVAEATPEPQDIRFITISGTRNGGSGEEINICDTSGFQQTELECDTSTPDSPYHQELDWNWIKENYR